MNSYQTAAQTAATGMKSDLPCQEASASSPAALSGGNRENSLRKSPFLGTPQPPVLHRSLSGFPEPAGMVSTRDGTRLPWDLHSAAQEQGTALPGLGLLHKENKRRLLLVGRRPGRILILFSFASIPGSTEQSPSETHLAPAPSRQWAVTEGGFQWISRLWLITTTPQSPWKPTTLITGKHFVLKIAINVMLVKTRKLENTTAAKAKGTGPCWPGHSVE